MAETLPDVRDDTLSDGECEASVPSLDVRAQTPDVEPYSDFGLAAQVSGLSAPSSKRASKPRKMRKSIPIRPGRTSADCEERFLPPGTMKEYYTQYTRQSSLEKPASFPCFWRVAWP